MRISPVNFNFQYKISKPETKKEDFARSSFETAPGGASVLGQAPFVAFCGGKSLSLKETKAQIDKFGTWPPGIKEKAEEALLAGNPEDKTLIDIHREKYAKLNDLETLEEAKAEFPEFNGVLPDKEVVYQEGSFIDEVKKGNIKGFDPDKDVALQLLQLYWGEGFSLSALKDDYAGQNIHKVFAKLNIPRTDRVYAQYLKLSDKEYNERYTKSISERMKGLERKQISKEGGEKIPRGPLSKEHRANISKGLKEYYKNHPEKIAEMSERELEYYKEHPEEKEKMTQIMLRAWSYREATPVKKRMSKFLKKPNVSDEELSDVFGEDNTVRHGLKEFWRRNPWAKERFSICMQKSWARQDELTEMGLIYEPLYRASAIPSDLKREIKENSKVEIPSGFEELLDVIIVDPRDAERYGNKGVTLHSPDIDEAALVASLYLRENDVASQNLADTYMMGMQDAMCELSKTARNSDKEGRSRFKELYDIWSRESDKKSLPSGSMSANGLKDIYGQLIFECVNSGDLKSAKKIDECIERNYKIASTQPEAYKAFLIGRWYHEMAENLAAMEGRR